MMIGAPVTGSKPVRVRPSSCPENEHRAREVIAHRRELGVGSSGDLTAEAAPAVGPAIASARIAAASPTLSRDFRYFLQMSSRSARHACRRLEALSRYTDGRRDDSDRCGEWSGSQVRGLGPAALRPLTERWTHEQRVPGQCTVGGGRPPTPSPAEGVRRKAVARTKLAGHPEGARERPSGCPSSRG